MANTSSGPMKQAGGSDSATKTVKVETPLELEFRSFASDHPEAYYLLRSAYNLLLTGDAKGETQPDYMHADKYILCPMEIASCNACYSVSFTDCFCHMEPYKLGLRLDTVCSTGFQVLYNFLMDKKLPNNQRHKTALQKLLRFIAAEPESLFTSEVEIEDEGEACLYHMNHLVSQLSVCEDWKMDRSTVKKPELKCPCNKATTCPLWNPHLTTFDDLSIGNKQVWHGSVDAMTFDQVPVLMMQEEDDDGDEQKEEIWCDFEFKHSRFKKLDQLYGETIVYSFLTNMLHKDKYKKGHFVPVLGLSRKCVIVSMYDSSTDVFLTTANIPFEGSYVGFLIVWLVCNFKDFFAPMNTVIFENVQRKTANFTTFANDKLAIYQHNLQFKQTRPKENALKTFKHLLVKDVITGSEDLMLEKIGSNIINAV